MKLEELFKKEFESLCGSDATTFIGESVKKALKGIDLDKNKYFYLLMEQKMDDPEWKEYGDCNEDAGKSWTYQVPVYYLGGENFETEGEFEGLEHFDEEKLTGFNYWDEEKEDWVECYYTEDQKSIIQYLDSYLGGEAREESSGWTGDSWKDNGVSKRDFYGV